jgi:hypothetical protein
MRSSPKLWRRPVDFGSAETDALILVRSAKTIRSDATLEEIDALCCTLEGAEQNQPRFRAVK